MQISDVSQLSDEEIIKIVKEKDKDCFSEIIKRYNQRLYRIAIGYGINDDDTDEVLQTTYIAAYEKLHQFRGDSKFSTWLTRILINECLMLKRKQKKTIRIDDEKLVTIRAGNHLNPQEMYMNEETKKMLENAIKQLPEKYKSVYILRDVEGMSIEETADALALSKINVKVRLHRARTMLKKTLKGIDDKSNLFSFGNDRCDKINVTVMDYIRKKDKSE